MINPDNEGRIVGLDSADIPLELPPFIPGGVVRTTNHFRVVMDYKSGFEYDFGEDETDKTPKKRFYIEPLSDDAQEMLGLASEMHGFSGDGFRERPVTVGDETRERLCLRADFTVDNLPSLLLGIVEIPDPYEGRYTIPSLERMEACLKDHPDRYSFTDDETPMTLEDARKLLQTFVSISETQIIEGGRDFNIEGYSSEDLKRASLLVIQDLLKTHKPKTDISGEDYEEKMKTEVLTKRMGRRKGVRLELISFSGYVHKTILPWDIEMTAMTHDTATEIKYGVKQSHDKVNFRYEKAGQRVLTVETMLQTLPITPEGYRFLVRGMRWLFINMLEWDNSYISPEQLGDIMLDVGR